jgi:hypothetical protein
MIDNELHLPARLFLYGIAPIVEGTLADCVEHWKSNMSQLGPTLCRVRVKAPRGAYWMAAEDIQQLVNGAYLRGVEGRQKPNR